MTDSSVAVRMLYLLFGRPFPRNPLAPETELCTQGWSFSFSADQEPPPPPMYQSLEQLLKCNASTPTKPILHEKCNYHGKDEYSHVFYGALIFPIAILSIIWYNISVKLVAKTDNNPQTMCKTVIVAELFSLGCEEPVWDYQAYAWCT